MTKVAEPMPGDPFKDPVKLAASARLILSALARQGLTLADLPDTGPLCDCGQHGGQERETSAEPTAETA